MGKRDKRSSGSRGSVGLNKKRGEEYLEKNRRRPEVAVTDSGLQYEVIREGTGKQPCIDTRVTVDQRILLVEGTVIGDTYKSGVSDTLLVSEGVEGYSEALLMMKEGARYKISVPWELAWGKKGTPSGKIGPYATLIFDLSLIKVF